MLENIDIATMSRISLQNIVHSHELTDILIHLSLLLSRVHVANILLLNNITPLLHLINQEPPFSLTHLTDTHPRQLQHLHIFQRVSLLSLPLLQLLERDWRVELLFECHVDY